MNDPEIEKAVDLMNQLARQLIIVDTRLKKKKVEVKKPEASVKKKVPDELTPREQVLKVFKDTSNLKHSITALVSITGFKYRAITQILKGEEFVRVERGMYRLDIPEPEPYQESGTKNLTMIKDQVGLLRVMQEVLNKPMRPTEIRMAITQAGYKIDLGFDEHGAVCDLLTNHSVFRRIGKGYYECVS